MCFAHTRADISVVLVMYTHRQVQSVEPGGGLAFLSAHRPADLNEKRCPEDGLVNRSCLAYTHADIFVVLVMHTHRQVPLVESGGAGGVSKCSPRPALFKPGQPQENTDASRMRVYTYIYISIYIKIYLQ